MGLTLLPVFYANGGFGGAAPKEGQRRFLSDVDGISSPPRRRRKSVRAQTTTPWSESRRIRLRAVTPESLERRVGNCLATVRSISTRPSRRRRSRNASPGRASARSRGFSNMRRSTASWCLIHATHLDAARRALLPRVAPSRDCARITEANLGDGIFEGARYLRRAGGSGSAPIRTSSSRRRAS